MLERETNSPNLADYIRDRSLARESYPGGELLGMQAADFWAEFIANNLPLIRSGELATYSQAEIRHMTHPIIDYLPTPNIAPPIDIIIQLLSPHSYPLGYTKAISHTFGLSDLNHERNRPWFGEFGEPERYGGLIGIDLEAPCDEEFLDCLKRSFDDLGIPVVIFKTGASYFASCFGRLYLDDFALLRDYALIVERIAAGYEPEKSEDLKRFTEPLKRAQNRKDLKNALWAINKGVGHWNEPGLPFFCADLRTAKNSYLASGLHRALPFYVDMCGRFIVRSVKEFVTEDLPEEPFLNIQMHLRVGEKRGGDVPEIVYASEQLPFMLGKTIPFYKAS